MKVTKLEHSGLMIKEKGKILLCDPVEFTEKLPKFENVVAIIITHKHGDHLQPEVIERIIADNPNVQILTTEDAVGLLSGAVAVQGGESREIEGFNLQFFGRDHASIVAGQVPCQNLGVIINGAVANPGDSFDLPPVTPKLLLVPISAPWAKVMDAVDYALKVRPEKVLAVHDAVLSELGRGYSSSWLKAKCEEAGISFADIKDGESIEI